MWALSGKQVDILSRVVREGLSQQVILETKIWKRGNYLHRYLGEETFKQREWPKQGVHSKSVFGVLKECLRRQGSQSRVSERGWGGGQVKEGLAHSKNYRNLEI